MSEHFVLLHGAWHGGWCWDKVARELEAGGHTASAPTLPDPDLGMDPADITLDDYVQSLVKVLNTREEKVILVGHSSAGIIMQAAAPLAADKISRLIFHNAFVLPHGMCQFDLVPPEVSRGMTQAAKASPDGCVPIMEDFVRTALMPEESKEAQDDLIGRLNTQPLGLFLGKIDKKPFDELAIPKSVLFCKDDASLPPGGYLDMAKNLGEYNLVELSGGHESLWSNPAYLADGILKVSGLA